MIINGCVATLEMVIQKIPLIQSIDHGDLGITHDFRNKKATLTPKIPANPTAASGSTPSYRYMRVGQAQTGSPEMGGGIQR